MALPTGGAMLAFATHLARRILVVPFALIAGSAAAEPLSVVASLPPIALIAKDVMGGRGTVEGLGDGGDGHAHGGSLRPSDARALDGADVVFWIGQDLEPTVARALPAGAASIALGSVGGLSFRTTAAGAPDPHVWLSPSNAEVIARAVATALAERDPEGAADYQRNAGALAERIAAAGTSARERLGDASAAYAVEHDAFGYFADWMGLEPAIVAGGQGARSLRAAAADARERGIACVVAEPGEPARLAAVLDGVPTVTIDPLGRELAGLPELIESVAAGFDECLNGADGAGDGVGDG